MTPDDVRDMTRDTHLSNLNIFRPTFRVGVLGEGSFLQVEGYDTNGALQRGRKWYISSHACDNEVHNTMLLAWLTFMEHEAREAFRFLGEKTASPHMEPYALAATIRRGLLPEDVRV